MNIKFIQYWEGYTSLATSCDWPKSINTYNSAATCVPTFLRVKPSSHLFPGWKQPTDQSFQSWQEAVSSQCQSGNQVRTAVKVSNNWHVLGRLKTANILQHYPDPRQSCPTFHQHLLSHRSSMMGWEGDNGGHPIYTRPGLQGYSLHPLCQHLQHLGANGRNRSHLRHGETNICSWFDAYFYVTLTFNQTS